MKQGHGFRRASHVHGVGLQSLDSQCSRLFCPIGIDLNAIAMSGYIVKQASESDAVADAGIDCRELHGEN